MKIIRINALWLFSVVLITPGCASIEEQSLYNLWQEHAYSAYGMTPPAPGSNPILIASRQFVLPISSGAVTDIYQKQVYPGNQPVSSEEKEFIAKYYTLQ